MSEAKVYFVRHVSAGTTGYGEIVGALSTSHTPVTMDWVKRQNPKWFDAPGHYTLLQGVEE